MDTTGRRVKAGKRGAIPAELPPILRRLGLEPEGWVRFAAIPTLRIRAIGQLEALKDLAADLKQKYLRGQYALAKLFRHNPPDKAPHGSGSSSGEGGSRPELANPGFVTLATATR